MNIDSLAWGLQIASCLFMAGVISIVQLIHYPSFRLIDRNQFSKFHAEHTQALGIIAGPSMLIELVTAIWICQSGEVWLMANLAAVVALWIITFGVSVPAHNRLASGFDEAAWLRLVRSNWLRTLLWISRGALMISFLVSLDF